MSQNFTHLHLHTSFSLLDGFGVPSLYAARAVELAFESMAITDHGNVDGAIKFQTECEKVGIRPIFGCEFYIVKDHKVKEKGERRGHVTALAKSRTGWENILKMITLSYLDGFYYRPRISPEVLLNNKEDLIIMSACTASFLNFDFGIDLFHELKGEDFYLEVMPHGFDEQLVLNKLCNELSVEHGVKLVATNDCHYVNASDAQSQEVLLAIQTNKKWNDPDRWKFTGTDFYMKTKAEMVKSFRAQDVLDREVYMQAIENSLEIADKCKGFSKIEKLAVNLPRPKDIAPKTDYDALSDMCTMALYDMNLKDGSKYWDRLREELEVIKQKGFERYFLIVKDLIDWCKKEGIMTGPGRGSASGSLICYLLGITQVDPIKYDLIFARFISPDRNDLPDIDIDFEDVKRPLIQKYLEKVYGKWNIAGVSTFSYLRGKGALRDVSRVFNVPLPDVDRACSIIETKLKGDEGSEHTIHEAFEMFEEGKKFAKKYPLVTDIAINIEGVARNRGQHASAVIISGDDLRTCGRCAFVLGKDKEPIINWDKEDVEHQGLMKLDVLGLNMLSVLNKTKELIMKNTGEVIEFEKIALDDKTCFEEFSKGNNVGCFQVGSPGLRKFCQQLGIDDFGMLVHATSLYRPGTLRSGMADVFIRRKKGDEDMPMLHPVIEKITKETFGVILYQEQMMMLVHDLAGIEWKVVDKIRKVIAKSKGREALREYESRFIDGCVENRTISEEDAVRLWNDLVSFGEYSFNKCLTGDTVVYKASSGGGPPTITLKQIHDVWHSKTPTGQKYRSKKKLSIQQVKMDGRVRPGKIVGIYPQGEQEVFCITTESGKKIKATKNHRFMTDVFNIYKELGDFEVGDKIAVMGDKVDTRERGKKNARNIRAEADRIINYTGMKTTYCGSGFRAGQDNIAYKDGRQRLFNSTKKAILERSKYKCEQCGKEIYSVCECCGSLVKNGRPEYAHIKLLKDLDYDYSRYHNENNILLLCNSCHKKYDYAKGERRTVHSLGRNVDLEKIIAIEYVGVEETFDVEMEAPDHNFIANGFVSHNSHATTYSVITYWDMWAKTYFPAEFICALLTHGSDDKDKKNEYIAEAYRLNLDVRAPKVGISKAYDWVVKDKTLYAPFIEIKGVGDKTAGRFELIKKSDQGFYQSNKEDTVSTRFLNILNKIRAYDDVRFDDTEAEAISEYLDFSLVKNRLFKFKKFIKLMQNSRLFKFAKEVSLDETEDHDSLYFGELSDLKLTLIKGKDRKGLATANFKDNTGYFKFTFADSLYAQKKADIERSDGEIVLIMANSPKKAGSVVCNEIWFMEDIESGNIDIDLNLLASARFQNKELLACESCDLRWECRAPVMPTLGRHNIMIIGEAPGKVEDDHGRGFIGEAGNVLWEALARQGLDKKNFNVSNVVHCYPSKSKTPTRKHIGMCRKWLDEEIANIKPFIVLALGNTCIKYFTENDGGIMAKNGTTEWNEEHGFWICWAVHPSSTLYGPDNIVLFEQGIQNFAEKIKILGGL